MAKQPTNPVIINNLPTVTTRFLKDKGLLRDSAHRSGVISWRCTSPFSDDAVSSMLVTVNTDHDYPYVRFEYETGGSEQDYMIPLTRVPSNLGKGHIWHFKFEDFTARKLYLYDGRYMPRVDIEEHLYRCQVVSGVHKRIDQNSSRLKKVGEIIRYQGRKHYKTVYAGTWTKHQLKVQAAHNELQRLVRINLLKNI